LDQLKAEEADSQNEPKVSVEFSYQLKDDKKITTTPLIEFLAAKNQEKRDAKVTKIILEDHHETKIYNFEIAAEENRREEKAA
jgi:hypothetical protein